VIAFTGLRTMTRDGQALAEANNRLTDLQFAVVYFDRDWAQVSPRKIRNQYGDEESNIVIVDDSITFTRSGWSNLLGRQRSNLQRVQYLVDDDRLLRRYWRTLDHLPGEQPIQTVLLDDVESMEVAFLNALGKPIRSWPVDGSNNDGQPILLALRLELPDRGEIVRLLEVPDGVL
jgi:general secretion pathway protein J